GGTLAYSGTSQNAINAGSYVITPGGLTSGNYTLSYSDGALTVGKAALNITASAATKTYDGLAFTGGNGVSYSGLVNNESASMLGGTLAYGGTSQNAINAGSYLITPSGLTSNNYTLSYTDGALTVNKAALTVTAKNATKTFDGGGFSGGNGVIISGFVNNETAINLGGALSYGGNSQGAVLAGDYLITPQGYSSINYSILFVDGSLSISPEIPQFVAQTFVTQNSTQVLNIINIPPALVIEPLTIPVPTIDPVVPTVSPATTAITAGNLATPATLSTEVPVIVPTASIEPSPTTISAAPEAPVTAAVVPLTNTTTPGITPIDPAPTAAAPATPGITSQLPNNVIAGERTASPLNLSPQTAAPVTATLEPATATSVISQPTSSDMLPEPAFKAAVTTIQQGFSGGAEPTASLDALTNSQVTTAISRGLPAAQAEQASKTYQEALVKNLSNGLPMSEAVARAEQVFKAEASFPAPKSAQEAAAKSVLSSGGDVSTKLDSLANTQTSSGTSSFDKALGVALLKGMSFDEAVKAAQVAGQSADVSAKADTSPMSGLSGGGDPAKQFANTTPGFQKTLSALLAKGIPLAQATEKATIADQNATAAANADANNLSAGLSSGNFAVLEGKPLEGSFGKVLSANLAKGMPVEKALARAIQVDALEQQGIQADANSPLAGLSNGSGEVPAGNADFDHALAVAISRGMSPADAIIKAKQTVTKMPPEVKTPSTALASGNNIDSLLASHENSTIFKAALGNALAKGVPVERALAIALKAEKAYQNRPSVSQAPTPVKGGQFKVTLPDDGSLPKWLRYLPATGTYIASEVPVGKNPIALEVSPSGKLTMVVIK
ncbi:MAG: MBG domain-containing protein, partial [Gallionellaceae bacterium]